MKLFVPLLSACLCLGCLVDVLAQEFRDPVRLHTDGQPIDTEVGHAAPLYDDFDGDGVKDLLVGQFGDGILRIYRNTGSDDEPVFAAGVEFKDGTDGEGRVPTG